MKIKNKKAVSEMVSYVLLIVIAVGLSVLVFAFLRLYVPKFQVPECPDGISLTIQEYSCSASTDSLQLKIHNRGLCNVTSVFVRFHPPGKEIQTYIDKSDEYFNFEPPFAPGATTGQLLFPLTQTPSITEQSTIEVQPAVYNKKNELALCDKAVITQKILCS